MTSSLIIPPRTSDYTGDPLPTSKVDASDLDGDVTMLRQSLTDIKAVLDGLLRGDDTILDGYVRSRMLHTEVLDYIQANGGGGQISGGSPGTSVKAAPFNATGDGVTDDTDAIQACIDAVNAAGGGVVYFPAGTYRVRVAKTTDSTWRHCLTVYQGITLRGESRERSVIKMLDAAGNYRTVFGRGAISDTDLHDFSMHDLCVDHNTDNNYPASLSALESGGGARNALIVFGGHRVQVCNCKFTGIKSVNTLTFNAPVGLTRDIYVAGNLFEMAASATINNDHSTIYTNASEVVITGNQFRSPAKNTFGARTAIETHGSNHVVSGNVIYQFLIGMNITGVAYRSDNVSVCNNVIDGTRYGIVLWAWFYGGNTTEPSITNLTISGNSIRLDRDPWALSLQVCSGISFDEVGYAPVRGLKIIDNFIFFEVTAMGIAQDNLSAGIGWNRGSITPVGGVGYDEDVTISGNTVINAIGVGIDIRGPIKGLRCESNNIINPGRSTYGPLSNSFRSGILIFPNVAQVDWLVARNRLYDDRPTPGMIAGIAFGGLPATNCRCEDNSWVCVNKVNGTHYPATGGVVAGASWFHRWTIPDYNPSFGITGNTRCGSSILNPQTGIRHVQTTAPEGTTYVAESTILYPAGQIPYGKSDGSGGIDKSSAFRFVAASRTCVAGSNADGTGEFWSDGPVGGTHGFRWSAGGLSRFLMGIAGAEGGADAGADLSLYSYNDAGTYIDTVIQIVRKAGSPIYIGRPLRLSGGITPDQLIVSADTSLTINNTVVTYTGSGGHTLTAPAANVIGSGRPWIQVVKNRGSGRVIYAPAGADTIDGITAGYPLEPGECATFAGNGATDINVQSMAGSQSRIFTRLVRAVNLNSANTDVGTVTRLPGNYRVRKVTVYAASLSLTTATYSLRTATGGAGTAIVNNQGLTALTGSNLVTESAIASTDRQTAGTLTIRCNTAQGAAATADFLVEIESLT